MDYPARFEWQTRCEFNAYCKRTLRNELIDACRERKSRRKHEVSFADLTPQEEKQLYTVDKYFVNEDEDSFLCRRFEDYGEAACRSNALPAGRKTSSRTAVLLFRHDRC